MSETVNGDKPEGRSYDRIHAPAFMFSPRKIARRISYSKRKVEPLRGWSLCAASASLRSALCLRRRVYNNDDGAGRIDNGNRR